MVAGGRGADQAGGSKIGPDRDAPVASHARDDTVAAAVAADDTGKSVLKAEARELREVAHPDLVRHHTAHQESASAAQPGAAHRLAADGAGAHDTGTRASLHPARATYSSSR